MYFLKTIAKWTIVAKKKQLNIITCDFVMGCTIIRYLHTFGHIVYNINLLDWGISKSGNDHKETSSLYARSVGVTAFTREGVTLKR